MKRRTGFWTSSSRFVEVDTAFRWGVPLHVWRGKEYPDKLDKAEMVAYCKSRADKEEWETFVNTPIGDR